MTNVYGYFTGDSPNQNNNVAPGSVMALFYSGRTYGQTPGDAGAKYGDYNFGKAVQQLEVYLGLD
ncbi:MAG: hypothetical protein Q8O00_02810 [Holophaga sp.]|nr:hypothetical protein [Holophaga sp.]